MKLLMLATIILWLVTIPSSQIRFTFDKFSLSWISLGQVIDIVIWKNQQCLILIFWSRAIKLSFSQYITVSFSCRSFLICSKLSCQSHLQPRNKSVLVAIYLRLGKPQKSIWSLSEGIGSMLILNISPKWPLNGIKIEKWPKYDLNMMSIWLPYTIYRRLSADLFHQCL